MASLSQTVGTGTEPARDPRAADPYNNPSYPQRVHLRERPALEEALRSCDERLDSAFQKLGALANHAQQALFVRLYHQMQGARDQVADCVRRIPLEAGALYHEDREKFQQAMEALDRTWSRWQTAGG